MLDISQGLFFFGGGVEEFIGWASDKGGFYGTEESVSQGDILDTSLNPYTVFHFHRLWMNIHAVLATESVRMRTRV